MTLHVCLCVTSVSTPNLGLSGQKRMGTERILVNRWTMQLGYVIGTRYSFANRTVSCACQVSKSDFDASQGKLGFVNRECVVSEIVSIYYLWYRLCFLGVCVTLRTELSLTCDCKVGWIPCSSWQNKSAQR